MHDNTDPPSGYCGPVEKLRAAEQRPETPEEQFERRYKNMRMRALQLEQPAIDRHVEEGLRALEEYRASVTDLANYVPPNPYEGRR